MRTTFLSAAGTAAALLATDELARAWEAPSALAELSCGALAGHLARGISTVVSYLDEPEPPSAPLDAVGYYLAAAPGPDLDAPGNVAVRARSVEAAAVGSAVLAARAATELAALNSRLARERDDRRLAVISGRAITLDEYLRTRITELVVHSDDLAVSLGLEVALDLDAQAVAIDLLVALARARHGELAVLRALSRRERDTIGALRVF